jgi:hypothetical protein
MKFSYLAAGHLKFIFYKKSSLINYEKRLAFSSPALWEIIRKTEIISAKRKSFPQKGNLFC